MTVPTAGGQGAWLRPVRFDYGISRSELAVVSLLAHLDAPSRPPNAPSLLVRRADASSGYPARASDRWRGSALLWQVSFEVPLDVVVFPGALFTLAAANRIAIALPAPGLRSEPGELAIPGSRRAFGPLIRRRTAALAAGVAFAAVPNAFGGVALGASASTPPVRAATSPPCTSSPAPGTASPAQPPAGGPPTTCPARSTTLDTETPAGTSTSKTSTPSGATTVVPKGHQPAATTSHRTAWRHSTPTDDSAAPASCAPTTGSAAAHAKIQDAPRAQTPHSTVACVVLHTPSTKRRQRTSGRPAAPSLLPSGGAALTLPRRPRSVRPAPLGTTHRVLQSRRTPGTTAPALVGPSGPWTAGPGISASTAAAIARFSAVSSSLGQPPAFLIPIYKAAGRKYGIPWQILAAVNAVETHYGQDLSVSPAGALGWMQFMPATWSEYGVDVGGHGRPNPYDPSDAIFSAARLLAASGGGRDIRRALFTYNHATWYVDAVLWRAALISDHGFARNVVKHGYALPLDAWYMVALGRTDDGVDIENAPDGAAVYSITPGVVTAVASDPAGFGPDYPVVLATAGPLAGQNIYYGHVAASLVKVGQDVQAGQPIAVMGHTGDAAALGHGHIEIGFSDGSGDPLNHHGASAWTPSGAAMRSVLVALSGASKQGAS